MDLNYLYHRRQVAQYHADNAVCDQSRHAHQVMATAYSSLIDQAKINRAQVSS
jgi:hypothetical protein